MKTRSALSGPDNFFVNETPALAEARRGVAEEIFPVDYFLGRADPGRLFAAAGLSGGIGAG
jgi:hypothetical protein